MKKTTFFTKIILTLAFLLCGLLGIAQTTTITSTGTYTVPAGITSLTIHCWGGGGAGGGTTTTVRATGGGGGGGTYTYNSSVAVTPGDVITVTIGDGGVGVVSANGNSGGTTTFASMIPVSAIGGNGGQVDDVSNLNGLGATAATGITYNGGAGGTGNSTPTTQNFSGAGGGSPGDSGNGGSASIGTAGIAGTGITYNGFGGANGRNSSGNGGSSSGSNYGAGGAGGNNNTTTARIGGNGTAGKIVVICNATPPEINIQGNATNIVDGSTSYSTTDYTDFSNTNTGVPVTYSYTIENTGSGTLTIGAITLGDNTNYSYTNPVSTSITSGNSTTFTVTFNPTTAGVKNTTISIVTNDSDENPYNFAITGTGLAAPEINIKGNAIIIADEDPTPSTTDDTDFGSTNTGVGVIKTYTVTNTGSTTLTLGAITLGDLTNYSASALGSTSLAAGATTTFTVTFNPTTIGIKNTTVSIVTNDSDENPYNFSITGTGTVPPEIDIQGGSPLITITDGDSTPSTAEGTDFGSTVNVGATVTKTYTVYNTGSGTLTLGTITLGDTTNYSKTNPTSTTLLSGASTTFTITFNPTTAGVKASTFSILTNDTDENPYNFSITGTAIATNNSSIVVTGNTNSSSGSPLPSTTTGDNTNDYVYSDFTDFGDCNITGQTITRTFVIQSFGPKSLTISGSILSSNGLFTITQPTTTILAPGTATTFSVTFDPIAVGTQTTTITINNDSPASTNVYTFGIQGTGINPIGVPEINILGNSAVIPDGNVTYNSYDNTKFGQVATGSPSTRTYSIQNLGTANLTIGTITSSSGQFTVTQPGLTTIPAGGSTTFTVTFAATNPAGTITGTITIPNNDTAPEDSYTFGVEATEIAYDAREIEVTGNSINITHKDVTPNVSDFTILGETFPSTALARTYTIKNTGTANLTTGAITFTGTNNTEFAVSGYTAGAILPGGTTNFTVTFLSAAAAPATRVATVNIVNDDSNEGTGASPSTPFLFDIQGLLITNPGAVPEIEIKGNTISIASGDTTPSTIDDTDFGSTLIINSPISKTYTVRNFGGSNLTLSGTPKVSITGSTDFTVTTQPTSPVTTLGNSTFTIQFNPSSIGTRTATVTITNDDSSESSYTFTIQGTGIQTFFDSDNDSVFDNIDIDDDNDGITDVTEETDCSTALGLTTSYKVLNETFGTGGRTTINATYNATSTYCYEDGSVSTVPTTLCTKLGIVSGTKVYTNLDDGEYAVVSSAQDIAEFAPRIWYKGGDHTGDTNGRMAIFNANFEANTFYTATVTGIVPNLPITFSFYAINLDRADALNVANRLKPNIIIEFRDMNDVLLKTITTGSLPASPVGATSADWQLITATPTPSFTLGVDSFKVSFMNNEIGGNGNDLAIDDISITQTLCDSDRDGVPNLYDLDSDNDGIPDVAEAGFGSMTTGRGIIAPIIDTSPVNAMHDATESLTRLDSDGDGIPNYIDLDSDNDSVFDVDEGPINTTSLTFTNGDGDITGDGKGDGLDSESFREKDSNGDGIKEYFGDGILDLYDKSLGAGNTFSDQYGNLGQGTLTGNTATDYLKDTDGDNIPDYLDTMSNGTTLDIANNILIYAPKVLDNIAPLGILDGTTDIDKDGILDIFDTSASLPTTTTTTYGSPRDLNKSLYLDFDGRNDYAQDVTVLAGSAGSLMAWIDLNSAFATDGFIVGQNSFHLKVTSGRILQVTCNGTTLNSPTALDMQRWYHAAATYNGTTLKLFLNGTQVATTTASGSIVDATLLTIGRSPAASTNFFKGKIDEVRVFNLGLTNNQVQRMAYQEIDATSPNLKGTYITYKEIDQNLTTSTGALNFTNLLRYYRMDAYKDDILDNLTTPTIDIAGTKIYNHKNIHLQQAPMPFVTIANGDLATSITDATKDIQGSDVNNYSTIVNVKHDNTSTVSRTDVGLIVDSGKSLTVNNDQGLTNTWYLKLDGKIDLEGASQLVQNSTSDLDVTSAGSLHRDQQGQSNFNNYNYWSSPVSPINITANNTDYTVDGVMKDGINTTPRNITWVAGYDGFPGNTTTPVSLARYWLYKFESAPDAYANWIQFLETDALRVGQGYTLKGSGAAANFTFVGKPNNGTITSNIVTPDELLLVGNPYPSALDADQFINDNINSVDQVANPDGTLYFWEHSSTNNSHIIWEYLGGYASYNLSGGLPPVTTSLISGVGASAKIPKRYIPVGQGFFVYGKPSGSGPVIFNNGQRAFKTEIDPESTSLFKTKASTKTNKAVADSEVPKTYKKIRLGYNNQDNYHRQVLLAFMEDKATSGIDYGYDAEIMDDFSNDMFFLNGKKQLVIEGESYFDTNAIYPIGVKSETGGKVSFVIDDLENFDPQQPVFIHDNITNIYHDIRTEKFEIDLPLTPTTVNKRFSLRFTNKTLSVDENVLDENAITISHIQKGNRIEINTELVGIEIENLSLFNMLGQSVASWEIENQQNIQLPLKGISTGVYIAKIKTSKGDISKKIIIK